MKIKFFDETMKQISLEELENTDEILFEAKQKIELIFQKFLDEGSVDNN